MDSFRWIAVALSLVLGLGVTRLLSAAVAMFRSRGRARLDWLPLAWALCIFVWQIQYWWAIEELTGLVATWTLARFLLLLALALLLFLAAALVLPPAELSAGESLADSFERDGRFALICLSAYFLLSLVANAWLWAMPLLSVESATSLALALVPLGPLVGRSRRRAVASTLGYAALTLWAAWLFSPASY